MVKRFALTEDAVADLEEIIAYLAQESELAALSLADDFEHAFAFLAEWPGAGHRRQDLTDAAEVRFWTTNGYCIAYDASRLPILVVCVLHGTRNIPSLLSSRLEQI